jgi:hypothetical protein
MAKADPLSWKVCRNYWRYNQSFDASSFSI